MMFRRMDSVPSSQLQGLGINPELWLLSLGLRILWFPPTSQNVLVVGLATLNFLEVQPFPKGHSKSIAALMIMMILKINQ